MVYLETIVNEYLHFRFDSSNFCSSIPHIHPAIANYPSNTMHISRYTSTVQDLIVKHILAHEATRRPCTVPIILFYVGVYMYVIIL